MTAPVAVSVLLGLIGVPLVLLEAGRRFRRFGPLGRGAFRGGIIGYITAASINLILMLVPPFVWPPESMGTRIWLIGGLLLGPTLGAVIGGLASSGRR